MANIQDIRSKVAPSSSTRRISQITKIARHHSATTSGDYFAFWNNRWKGLGWGKGGYAEIILTDGTVQLCYDPIYPTNGIGNHNTNTYHICVVGNGAFTAAQERAFEERCLLAMQNFGLGVEDVFGHNEFSGTSTACPGINMDTVRARLAAIVNNKVESAATNKGGNEVAEAYEKNAKPSPSLANEFNAAVNAKITDGTYPKRPATREEVAVMVYRALKK